MNYISRYSLLIGLILFAIVLVVLLSPPDMIFAQKATFIGADLNQMTDYETPVRTKMDIGNPEHIVEFPMRFGDWLGLDYDAAQAAERLGGDCLLLRTYLNIKYYQPINFVVLQSDDRSSFHPPPVCYRAAGWKVEEEGTVEIQVQDTDWASQQVVDIDGALSNPIVAKSMLASFETDDVPVQREVVVYFYVKGRMFEDSVTLVEVSLDASPEGNSEDELITASNFVGETIPHLFEPAEEDQMMGERLAKSWAGICGMVVSLLIPLAMVGHGLIRQVKRKQLV
ncbi:MAG: exosortase-associated EpsI family protein [Chloroflexota bacterium]|nr:exosortase-associated EpsI family protein [Chloroflexota bacterium]